MRCKACNTSLNEFEATRKSEGTNEFIDLCNTCYYHIKEDFQVIENYTLMDLKDEVDIEDNF